MEKKMADIIYVCRYSHDLLGDYGGRGNAYCIGWSLLDIMVKGKKKKKMNAYAYHEIFLRTI